jgi:hypothetical protein
MSMGTCRSCRAPIVWAKKADGKPIPLDQVPPSTGNIRIENGFAVVGGRGTGPYQPHFVTCPDSIMWRRGKTPPQGTGGGNAA